VSPMTTDHPTLTALLRPLHRYAERITVRADADARSAGLTVEAGPGGVRRYRDPRLDQRAARHRAPGPYAGVRTGPEAEPTSWSIPVLTVSASLAEAGWSR
jgi:hypothetical protein